MLIIINSLNHIGTISSTNEKIKCLKTLDCPEVRKILEYTYSPFKKYGITMKEPTSVMPSGSLVFNDDCWTLLDKLVLRELTGNAAREALDNMVKALEPTSQGLLWKIISKDLRIGINSTTVNKVYPGLIPEFPYMRCSLPKAVKLNEWPWERGVYSQEKADGMYVNVLYGDNIFSIESRNGQSFPV